MRTIRLQLICVMLFSLLGLAATVAAEESGFKPIFDGKTLNGWKSPNMSYFSVTDGAITARATRQNPCKANQFLVWQLGKLDDFELKLKYRISGTQSANSGIQIRSLIADDGHAVGYQADIDIAGKYAGCLYDEHARGMLAQRGQKTVIKSDGIRIYSYRRLPDNLIKKDDWNDYHIIALGNRITLKVNGKVTAELIDGDEKNRDLSGALALQLHSGPPMTVQFKDIQLKRLTMCNKKKIVLIAGPPSHSYGTHEHNAGCLLLAKALNDNMPNVYAATYRSGWPKDPTAFDNANAVAIYCDGGGGHIAMRHLEQVDKLAKNDVGIAFIHYAVELPKGKPGNYALNWVGGYFETFWSVNPTFEAEITDIPRHPVTRGVKPFSIRDEWYYHMRFRENMENVTPILTAIPPDRTRRKGNDAHGANPHVRARMGMPEHLAWVYERPGGGRGFGFTGGHNQINWAHNDFRKTVLNGLVWIAGLDVPAEGVPSETPTTDQLRANMDTPDPGSWNWDRIRDRIEQWNSQ
ncbi:MAG: family 16 glycoside hydrolase [Planctomycetota bacterium]